MDTCDPNLTMVSSREEKPALMGMQLAAGIDWGTGGEHTSNTVLTIGGYLPDGRFVVVFCKKYVGQESDPEHQFHDIVQICRRFSINTIGADWGLGFGLNSRLSTVFGSDRIQVFFNTDNQRQPMKLDDNGDRWTLSRTTIMTDMFSYLKTRHIVLPKWEQTKEFASDALNIFANYATRQGSTVLRYDHIASKPDDWFHSLIYCYMAAVIARQTS